MKTCFSCKRTLALDNFPRNRSTRDGRQTYCRECHSTKQREWRERNPDKAKATLAKSYLVERYRRHGLTKEQYLDILKHQDYRCAICESPEPGGNSDWHIDHDHKCCPGRWSCGDCVRGLLCTYCNVGIGMLKDDPHIIWRASEYLL